MRLSDTPYLGSSYAGLAEEADVFVAQHVAPRAGETSDQTCREFVTALGKAGLLRWCVPAGHGGAVHSGQAVLDVCALALLRERLAAHSGLADLALIIQALGAGPISVAGNPAQQALWLPQVAAGTKVPAFALTEPEAGSDVASLRTTATRDGNHYIINGSKKFISQATVANVFCVFARTSDDGARGISVLLVPADAPGLRVDRQVPMAPHPLGQVILEDVRVPVENLLGNEGGGMKVAMRTLEMCRATVAAAACGMARRALDEALARARTRVQFGKPLWEHQMVAQKLARMATALDAAVLMTARACAAVNQALPDAALAVSQAKLLATESAFQIIDDAVQILGGDGVVHGNAVERLYREVRALRIYEGTSEIQHLVIARHLAKA